MRSIYLFVSILPGFFYADISQDVRRIQSHLLIDSPLEALREAEILVQNHPESEEAGSALIEALSANGFEDRALTVWDDLSAKHPNLLENRRLLEEMAWGILKKGVSSTQYAVKLSSLVGVYLTRDVRAVPILLKMMRDSNVVVRSVATRMSAHFCDAPLKDEIRRLMREEKVWMARLSVIEAAGGLRMKDLAPQLKAMIQSDKSTYEERQLAIQAMLSIYDRISFEEWLALARSNRAGMRHFAGELAAHFEIKEAEEEIVKMIGDSHPAVRIAALNAFGLFYRHQIGQSRSKEILVRALQDSDPVVAITAGWAAIMIDRDLGQPLLERWLNDSFPENRRLAAAAVAASGASGIDLAMKMMQQSEDPYVKVNLAIGLLGQRMEIKKSCDLIFDFLQSEKRMWMWDDRSNPLFQVLSLSQVRYVDHIPNYPEAIDQMTRLNLVSLLALVEDHRAVDALKNFLQKRHWGITGVAAATLLQEGDDSSLGIVRQLLQDPDPDVRLQACLVLAMIGRDDSVLADLQGAYGSASHERKLHILEAVARIGSVRSHSFLLGLLKEPFPILRVSAAAALIQSLNQ